MVEVEGVEPSLIGSEPIILPLDDTSMLVGPLRIELRRTG